MRPEIRDRMRKVRALCDSTNPGEASAARARYADMVAKYGDPGKSERAGDREAMFRKINPETLKRDLMEEIFRRAEQENERRREEAVREYFRTKPSQQAEAALAARWIGNFMQEHRAHSRQAGGWFLKRRGITVGVLTDRELQTWAKQAGWDGK